MSQPDVQAQALARALQARRAALLAAAGTRGGDLTGEEVADLDKALASLGRVSAELDRADSWRAPVLVAAAAVLLVALASVIRIPQATFTLDAQISAVELITDDDRGETGWTSEPIRVQGVEFGGGVTGPGKIDVITSLRMQPGTLARLTAQPRNCLLLEVRRRTDSKEGGVDVQALRVASGEAMPEPYSVALQPGSAMHFCPLDADGQFLVGRVRVIDVSRLRFAGPPELRASSLLSGTLRIKETGGQTSLGPIDQLRFSSVRDGAVLLGVGKPLHLVFSGVAADPRQGGGLRDDARSLRPTLLEIMSSSPLLRALIGAVTGLVGLIWAGLRYLRL